MPRRKPILCLDFDGVIHSYESGWQGPDSIPDPPVEGALAFIVAALATFDVQIYSTRSHQPGGIDAMKDWLAKTLRPGCERWLTRHRRTDGKRCVEQDRLAHKQASGDGNN